MERFAHVIVHSALNTVVTIVGAAVGRYCNDDRLPNIQLSNKPRSVEAIQHWHLAIHQNEVVPLLQAGLHCLLSIRNNINIETGFRQRNGDHFLIDRVVFRY